MYGANKLLTSIILALGLWLPSGVAGAADQKACAIVGPAVAEGIFGKETDVLPLPGVPSGMDACDIVTSTNDYYTIVRDNAVFANAASVPPGAIAQMFFPQLTDDTLTQINSNQPGTSVVTAPGFEISTIAGIGDTALVVHTVPATMVTILVRRGADAFLFQTDDLAPQPARLTALAQALLPGSAPSVSVAGVAVASTGAGPATGSAPAIGSGPATGSEPAMGRLVIR